MKPDIYTKVVLTVIALALVVVALNQYISPSATAQAQGSFAGLQLAPSGDIRLFDPRTGEIWTYQGVISGYQLDEKVRLTKPGQPPAIEYRLK